METSPEKRQNRTLVTFPDHADRYEAYRPTYLDALLGYLASLALAHDLAWDCATGNGQASPRTDAPLPCRRRRRQSPADRPSIPHPKPLLVDLRGS